MRASELTGFTSCHRWMLCVRADRGLAAHQREPAGHLLVGGLQDALGVAGIVAGEEAQPGLLVAAVLLVVEADHLSPVVRLL